MVDVVVVVVVVLLLLLAWNAVLIGSDGRNAVPVTAAGHEQSRVRVVHGKYLGRYCYAIGRGRITITNHVGEEGPRRQFPKQEV